MASVTNKRATLDDLYRVEGKAELVNGEIVPMPPLLAMPGRRRVLPVLPISQSVTRIVSTRPTSSQTPYR